MRRIKTTDRVGQKMSNFRPENHSVWKNTHMCWSMSANMRQFICLDSVKTKNSGQVPQKCIHTVSTCVCPPHHEIQHDINMGRSMRKTNDFWQSTAIHAPNHISQQWKKEGCLDTSMPKNTEFISNRSNTCTWRYFLEKQPSRMPGQIHATKHSISEQPNALDDVTS